MIYQRMVNCHVVDNGRSAGVYSGRYENDGAIVDLIGLCHKEIKEGAFAGEFDRATRYGETGALCQGPRYICKSKGRA